MALIISILILGSLLICLKEPKTDSKFLDLAQAGLGGYLAILVQNKHAIIKE
jgi:hypothetical protein